MQKEAGIILALGLAKPLRNQQRHALTLQFAFAVAE